MESSKPGSEHQKLGIRATIRGATRLAASFYRLSQQILL